MKACRYATLLLALACGAEAGRSAAPSEPQARRADERATENRSEPARGAGATVQDAPAPSPLRPMDQATPMTLRIVNGRSTGAEVVTSFGELQPFRLERVGGVTLTLANGLVEGPSCSCRCGFECLECEPPLYQEVRVPAGGDYEVRWRGWVRRWASGCHEPYALGPGTYRVEACLGEDCQTQPVTFPQAELEFRFE